jgi:two-component system sensor histidine kinase/response regulator
MKTTELETVKKGSAPSMSGQLEKPLRILLAEDVAINRRLIQTLLTKKGCEVVAVPNGTEVLKTLETDSFDIILMDVQMPLMGGLEATKSIRKKEKESGRHTPIIALTGYSLLEDIEKCYHAGMDNYISKPIKFAELKEILDCVQSGKPVPAISYDDPRNNPPEISKTLMMTRNC